MDEIIKVFTKYDHIYKQINVPEIAKLEVAPLGDETCLSMSDSTHVYFPYYPMKIEDGLENVVFVHYKRGTINNNCHTH